MLPGGRLLDAPEAEARIPPAALPAPVLFCDVASGRDEAAPGGAASKLNRAEVAAAVSAVRRLRCELPSSSLCVLTPYRGQVSAIRRGLARAGLRAVEVATVDAFQGTRGGGRTRTRARARTRTRTRTRSRSRSRSRSQSRSRCRSLTRPRSLRLSLRLRIALTPPRPKPHPQPNLSRQGAGGRRVLLRACQHRGAARLPCRRETTPNSPYPDPDPTLTLTLTLTTDH